MKIKLGTGKVVDLIDEYGVRQTVRAAELADIPENATKAESMLFDMATVMVAVKTVAENETAEPKTIEQLTDGAVAAKDLILKFREAFTDAEWNQLVMATNQVYKDPKEIPAFEVLS